MLNKLIVIGNYPADRQQSMERFAVMIRDGVKQQGIGSEIWRPEVWLAGKNSKTNAGVAKWLGYIDKWIVYPILLRRKIRKLKRSGQLVGTRFHIADHSNAMYLRHLPPEQTSITCHDVLAIRGALGDQDTYCPASRTGKILQSWILKNLSKARKLAAVSQTTLDQLQELASMKSGANEVRDWRVILNGFNNDFSPMPENVAGPLVARGGHRYEPTFPTARRLLASA